MMSVTAIEYTPIRWAAVQRSQKLRILAVDQKLRTILPVNPPTYAALKGVKIIQKNILPVRSTILELVKKRQGHGCLLTQELTLLERAVTTKVFRKHLSVYEVAANVRALAFGSREPLRNFDMTITTHQWLRIRPPKACSSIFKRLSSFSDGPAIFGAINLYLALVSAHPFTDGNGRTSRCLFSLHLSNVYRRKVFVPLSELIRATDGQYEEAIAIANASGSYDHLWDVLLNLLDGYADHLVLPAAAPYDAFGEVIRLASQFEQGIVGADFNSMPPYAISFSDLENQSAVSKTIYDDLARVVRMLESHGVVEYAMLKLGDLIEESSSKRTTVYFFMNASEKENLMIRYRVLRSHEEAIFPMVVLRTGNLVVDAKLLANLTHRYMKSAKKSSECLVFISNFEVAHSKPKSLISGARTDPYCLRSKRS